ncbi:MAG: hypothetical protein K9N09_09085 [Candidatus Cloacimonetes bacterium]|nr:hypothetical protein [Candidatus Cloacimonadota bacterium]MCF7814555.1 hypothetical protein [Candidatus Cloacimonadota bacterium]MCF7868841.1 hypothetical protein [Candidatus Cloacimonadota bacterium]MCF7884219.1 hypothetical protein [Candidatus Cloacimonadota bacterium]
MKNLILIILLISSISSWCNIINVPADQPTIQAGIDAAADADTVLVQPGTYNESIDFLGKNITVASLYYIYEDPSFIYTTIISHGYVGSAVSFIHGEENSAKFIGFTISNCGSVFGGGIVIGNYSNPTLDNLVITGNNAGSGGGIYCVNSNPILTNLTITDNDAIGMPSYGGAIHFADCDEIFIDNCQISGNSAEDNGGGIYAVNCGEIIIEQSEIINNNSSLYGAGIYAGNCGLLSLENCAVTDNETGGSGGNFWLDDVICDISNSVINEGHAFSYGGGFLIENSDLTFNDIEMISNHASFGGAIYATDSEIFIQNALMRHNGGENGTFVKGINSEMTCINCIIADHECYQYGIILGSTRLINSVLYGNSAQEPNGDLFAGVHTIVNSIIWSNTEPYFSDMTEVHYSCVENGWNGTGNIILDPLFMNPFEYDFHLQDNSPCIGAGINEIEINGITYFAPDFDLEGNDRPDPVGSMPDMGAYENPLGEPQVEISNNQLPTTNLQLTNYPNPFNPNTTISFSVTQTSPFATIEIFNLKGQKVKTFTFPSGSSATREGKSHPEPVEGYGTSPSYSVVWNGDDDSGKPVSSGIYFARMKNGNKNFTRKMLLMK